MTKKEIKAKIADLAEQKYFMECRYDSLFSDTELRCQYEMLSKEMLELGRTLENMKPAIGDTNAQA